MDGSRNTTTSRSVVDGGHHLRPAPGGAPAELDALAAEARWIAPGLDEEAHCRSGRWVAGSLQDRSGRRMRSPRAFHPTVRPEPGAAERLAATLDEFAGLMSRTRGRDLNRANARVPATRLIRYDRGDALEIQVAHVARHLEQARRVREDPSFPRRAA